ncbi:MAG: transporter [Bryobacteraceae bacterium]
MTLASLHLASPPALAQELAPGAYSPSPVGLNMLLIDYDHRGGEITLGPPAPVQSLSVVIDTAFVAYVRTFGLAGRLANIGFAIPYSSGDLLFPRFDVTPLVHRSGLRDPAMRFSLNLAGIPAMDLKQFAAYRQKTNLGFSMLVFAPLGQYDPNRLINIGTNRWTFRPELGLTHAVGKWILETNAGVWFFTDNRNFFGGRVRSQDPVYALHFHVVRIFKPRMWLAVGATYYTGGTTSIDGLTNRDLQNDARSGATFALPISRRQSLKFSYSRGVVTRIGVDFQTVRIGYQ